MAITGGVDAYTHAHKLVIVSISDFYGTLGQLISIKFDNQTTLKSVLPPL